MCSAAHMKSTISGDITLHLATYLYSFAQTDQVVTLHLLFVPVSNLNS